MKRQSIRAMTTGIVLSLWLAAAGTMSLGNDEGGPSDEEEPLLETPYDEQGLEEPPAGSNDLDHHFPAWWTCTARGRIDAGLYGTFLGYGPGHAAARKSALAECAEIAAGCHVTSCRPGL